MCRVRNLLGLVRFVRLILGNLFIRVLWRCLVKSLSRLLERALLLDKLICQILELELILKNNGRFIYFYPTPPTIQAQISKILEWIQKLWFSSINRSQIFKFVPFHQMLYLWLPFVCILETIWSRLVVLESFLDLLLIVHHKWAIVKNWLI